MKTAALSKPRARAEIQLTPARVKAICELVAQGVPQAAAAGSVGIPRRTYQIWLKQGREPGAKEPYASLAEKVDAALDRYHVSRVVQLHEVGKDDPRVMMWELERRFREDWAPPERGGSVNVQVNIELERKAATEQLMAAALRALGDDPERLERFLAEIGQGQVVDGEAVEVREVEAA